MITQLEILSPRVISSPLPVGDGTEATDPIQIHSIDGLGPVAATVNSTQYGSVDGEFYQGSVVGKRNIVITAGLNPNWIDQTIEGLRLALYAYFMPKSQVTLRFTSTHMATVEITGYVESFEPNMFSKDPEIQISIICPQPEFVAVDATTVTGQTVLPTDTSTVTIDYKGTSQTGFTLDIMYTTGLANFDGLVTVKNNNPDLAEFIVTGQVDTTQLIRISTVRGGKFAHQVYFPPGSRVDSNLIGNVVPGSNWLQLDQGANIFSVSTSVAGLLWNLTYFAKYGGL